MAPNTDSRRDSVDITVAASELESWATAVFVACEVARADAALTSKVLVRTNLRGIDTHGISRIPAYVEKLRSGEVNVRPQMQGERREGALFFSGDGGLGQVVATRAVEAAVELSRETAIVPCFVTGSGHLAALGQFVLAAAEQGMVALMCQETPPLMAPLGASRPAIGNNPLAFAMPVAGKAPLVFDMATSVVARGNVLQAARDGSALPEGWAIGPDGEPTDDPAVALKGAMLPIAGHKGLGLAMLVQCLAGSLNPSAAAESASRHGATSSAGNVNAFLMVINPERLGGREVFDEQTGRWLGTYLDAAGKRARYPGQRAAECEAERLRRGVPLAASIVRELRQLGSLVGVPFEPATK